MKRFCAFYRRLSVTELSLSAYLFNEMEQRL